MKFKAQYGFDLAFTNGGSIEVSQDNPFCERPTEPQRLILSKQEAKVLAAMLRKASGKLSTPWTFADDEFGDL